MPRYHNAEGGDFRHLADSPLIDVGTFVEGLTEDYRGFPRPIGGGFDIGVSEFFDLDGDLMEDDWDALQGFDPEDSADGAVDADEHGLTNAQEFALGTDPLDGSEPPAEFFIAADGDDADGSGSLLHPWGTIQRAMAAARVYTNVHTIHVGSGTFEESITLPANVTLQGAGPAETRIQHFEPSDDEHVVVEMAENSAIQDLMITRPGLQNAVTPLLRIDDVYAQVNNVILDGGDNLFSIDVLVSGPNSSDGHLQNSHIRRLQFGIQAVDTSINIANNDFEGIRGDAIFIRLPDINGASAPSTPMLGREDDPLTGGNTFDNVSGNFIVNFSHSTTSAEVNDWGLYTSEAIQAKMVGDVDFEPFQGDDAVGGGGGSEGEGELTLVETAETLLANLSTAIWTAVVA